MPLLGLGTEHHGRGGHRVFRIDDGESETHPTDHHPVEGKVFGLFLVFLTRVCVGGGGCFDKPGEILASHTKQIKMRAIIITGCTTGACQLC